MATVEFCRISRRGFENSFDMRAFQEDMRVLATRARNLLRAPVRDKEFIAADLSITADDYFLTGTLGFAEDETLRSHDEEAFSWVKGPTTDVHGATNQTVVPFAIDLREHRRWCAHATTGRIRATFFRQAFEAVLNAAVAQAQLIPSRWEVDPVMSLSEMTEWLDEHPEVVVVRRVVKLTNPLQDVDEARRKMRALRGTIYRDLIQAPRDGVLETHNDVFKQHVSGIETGDVLVELEARVPGGRNTYKSEAHRERTTVRDYGANLQDGMANVLAVLVDFSEQKGDVVHEE